MNELYEIKLIKTENPILGLFFNKRFKKVKGNIFPSDMNKDKTKYMMLILSDESKTIVNIDKYLRYEISKEAFEIIKQRVEKESLGQAKIE